MSELEKLVQEAREAMEGTTPGEWRVDRVRPFTTDWVYVQVQECPFDERHRVASCNRDEDQRFVAAAGGTNGLIRRLADALEQILRELSARPVCRRCDKPMDEHSTIDGVPVCPGSPLLVSEVSP